MAWSYKYVLCKSVFSHANYLIKENTGNAYQQEREELCVHHSHTYSHPSRCFNYVKKPNSVIDFISIPSLILQQINFGSSSDECSPVCRSQRPFKQDHTQSMHGVTSLTSKTPQSPRCSRRIPPQVMIIHICLLHIKHKLIKHIFGLRHNRITHYTW